MNLEGKGRAEKRGGSESQEVLWKAGVQEDGNKSRVFLKIKICNV